MSVDARLKKLEDANNPDRDDWAARRLREKGSLDYDAFAHELEAVERERLATTGNAGSVNRADDAAQKNEVDRFIAAARAART